MQKYVFLISQLQSDPCYEFIPHRFGCYSFQLDADKRTLTKYQFLRITEHWALDRRRSIPDSLRAEDQKAICDIVGRYGRVTGNNLVREVYRRYPYYATNSEIAATLLSARDLAQVSDAKPRPQAARCFTIGYEGRSLEVYLKALMRQNVKLLCDLRRNPVSMKFGFSKRQLEQALNAVGMHYQHFPELGIVSERRQGLSEWKDYQALFDEYRKTTLAANTPVIERLVSLVRQHGRIALTCFEASVKQCHRGCVAEALRNRGDFPYRIMHL